MSEQAELEYERAAAVIRSMITAGRIQLGDLVKVREIVELAGAKYPTARVTAKHLEAEGILRALQGKGFEVIATPEDATAEQASAKELGSRLARTEDQVQALEFNLEALYGKLGIPYPGDGASEDSDPARRGQAG